MGKSAQGGNSANKTQRLAGLAIFTAIVIVLQLLGTFIRFGTVSISLVLVPIVIGAALYGVKAGAWLGFVFGLVTLLDSGVFMPISVFGTVLTCVLKGTCAGLCAALVYKALQAKNETAAVIAAAIVCPVVNTGLFLLGCAVFFMPTISGWAAAAGYESTGAYMLVGFVGLNFLFEVIVNAVLSPVIVRLIRVARKNRT